MTDPDAARTEALWEALDRTDWWRERWGHQAKRSGQFMEALRRFGQHTGDCASKGQAWSDRSQHMENTDAPCDCGLADALAAHPVQAEAGEQATRVRAMMALAHVAFSDRALYLETVNAMAVALSNVEHAAEQMIQRNAASLTTELQETQARVALLEAALREIERHCPCGARPESPSTHPHVGGCPVYEALNP